MEVQEDKIAVNLKCIVLTLMLAAGYWFLPQRNKWILLALLYVPYLALAWYDWMYDCGRNMGPTYLAFFYWPFKPPGSRQIQEYKAWSPETYRKVLAVDLVVLLGLIMAAPAFLRWRPSLSY